MLTKPLSLNVRSPSISFVPETLCTNSFQQPIYLYVTIKTFCYLCSFANHKSSDFTKYSLNISCKNEISFHIKYEYRQHMPFVLQIM